MRAILSGDRAMQGRGWRPFSWFWPWARVLAVGFAGSVMAENDAPLRLPSRVDLTVSPYFPPILRQEHESCAQEAGISTMMTYEWNRLRGTSALLSENQLAGRFVWHFLNGGENRGTELAEGWRLARDLGVPTVSLYGGMRHDGEALGAWPHGYEGYHAAMRHRVADYRFSKLATLNDLHRAKAWLAGLAKGRRGQGGLLAVEGRLPGRREFSLPEGSPEAGKRVVSQWGPKGAGHVMTYAGYDDRVGLDLNGDGLVTVDRDIDGDGRVGLADLERGAFLAVNSFGSEWGDGGKIYVLFRASAVSGFRRGQWLAGVEMIPDYRPLFTLRLLVETNCQAAVRVAVGVEGQALYAPTIFDGLARERSREPDSPERYSRFVTGGRRLSLGPARRGDGGQLRAVEIGVDLSGKVPMGAPAYLLQFQLDPPEGRAARGRVVQAALRRYRADGGLLQERAFAGLPRAMGTVPQRVSVSLR